MGGILPGTKNRNMYCFYRGVLGAVVVALKLLPATTAMYVIQMTAQSFYVHLENSFDYPAGR